MLSTMPRRAKLPKHLQPMLATLADAPFKDPNWVLRRKDGDIAVADDLAIATVGQRSDVARQSG